MKKELLRVEHLTKLYERVYSLDDLSFCLYEGEIIGITGLNRSGKTTLANILNGVFRQDAGTIWIDEKKVSISSPNSARSLGIYCIGQNPDLIQNLSIAENLSLFSQGSRKVFVNHKADLCKAQEVLNDMGLPLSAETKCFNLTLTEQRLLQIVKGFFIGCHILIIDNITNSYSVSEQQDIFSMLRLLRKRGCGVIFISQDSEQLFSICDRVLVLRKGYYAGKLYPEDYCKERLMNLLIGHPNHDLFSHDSSAIGEEIFRIERLCTRNLHNLSLSLHRSEILGISDIGSSNLQDLFWILTGDEPIESGSIFLGGQLIRQFSPENMLQNRIGFVFVSPARSDLFPNLTVAENINLLLLNRLSNSLGFLRPSLESYSSHELLESLPFPEKTLNTKVKDLRISREHEVMILLERWQKIYPHVLFLIDIFCELDVLARKHLRSKLAEISCQGTAIILVSADFAELMKFCDRMITLENGFVLKERISENKMLSLILPSKRADASPGSEYRTRQEMRTLDKE